MSKDIWKSISYGMLKQEKKISLSIVIAIALNIAIVVSIIYLSILYVDSMNQKAIEVSGSFADVGFVNPTEEQVQILANDKIIDYYGVTTEYYK